MSLTIVDASTCAPPRFRSLFTALLLILLADDDSLRRLHIRHRHDLMPVA